MDNLSIDDMRECLVECCGVDDDLLLSAVCVADGDPEKFEKVLSHFSGERYEKFTDPNLSHHENCPIAYELRPDRFVLEIELGNAEMQEIGHIQAALMETKDHLSYYMMKKGIGYVTDANGHNVGKWELK